MCVVPFCYQIINFYLLWYMNNIMMFFASLTKFSFFLFGMTKFSFPTWKSSKKNLELIRKTHIWFLYVEWRILRYFFCCGILYLDFFYLFPDKYLISCIVSINWIFTYPSEQMYPKHIKLNIFDTTVIKHTKNANIYWFLQPSYSFHTVQIFGFIIFVQASFNPYTSCEHVCWKTIKRIKREKSGICDWKYHPSKI